MDAGIGQFIPLILIFVIFYFFLIRPQQKKVKEHKLMVESLKRGDKVVTSGGIVGTIERVVDNEKVVVGFSGAGRPRELELRTTVKIEINDQEGKPIQPLDKLQIIRSVNFSDTDVLATQSHEAFHRSDIEKQLAIRIIERLQRIAP